ncbi:MAG: hypothetical protein ABR501_04390 [Pyrinomonadaceae bacterium]
MDSALISLMDSDIQLESADDKVPKSMLARVRSVLALPRQPPKSQIEVRTLAETSEKSESEVRELLHKAGLIDKRRLKYLPRNAITKAEELLGLKKLTHTSETIITPPRVRKTKTKGDPWRRIGPIQGDTHPFPGSTEVIHYR